jgi:hypothetical protein
MSDSVLIVTSWFEPDYVNLPTGTIHNAASVSFDATSDSAGSGTVDLTSTIGSADAASSFSGAGLAVELRRVRIPGYHRGSRRIV